MRADTLSIAGHHRRRRELYGKYPSDVPVLKQFANDPSEEVRELVRKWLLAMQGLETAEAHAEHIAWHLDVQADRIMTSKPEYAKKVLSEHFHCTTVEALASQLACLRLR